MINLHHRSLTVLGTLAVWQLLVTSSGVVAQANNTKFAFALSEAGFNRVGTFTLKEGLKILSHSPVAVVQLQSSGDPVLNPLAAVELRNYVGYNGSELLLTNRTIGLLVRRPSLRSRVDIAAELWPMLFGEEQIQIDLELDSLYVAIRPQSNDNGDGVVGFELQKCSTVRPRLAGSAQYYWIVNGGVKLATKWIETNFEQIACAQIQRALNAMTLLVSQQIPLKAVLRKETLPGALQDVVVHYKLTELNVGDNHMSVGLAITWSGTLQSGLTNGTSNGTQDLLEEDGGSSGYSDGVQIEFGKNRHHLTVWMRDSVVNELLQLFDWKFQWMSRDVPITSTHIPAGSRAFLTTLCPVCYFHLDVWSEHAPSVTAANNSLILTLYERVVLNVINPKSNRTAVFANFLLDLECEIVPYLENGTLKARIDLLNTEVTMEKGAFPPQWKEFIQVLIQGMINVDMWTAIRDFVQSVSKDQGVLLPTTCGIDGKSASIHIEAGRFGVGVRLNLADFTIAQCMSDLRQALPKLHAIEL